MTAAARAALTLQVMLFKFLPLEYAEKLVRCGELQLSLPSAFHDEEGLGNEIGDRSDGVSVVTAKNLILDGGRVPDGLRDGIGDGVRLRAKSYVRNRTSKNVLIYCTSRKFLPKGLRLGDVCVEIVPAQHFADCISRALGDSAKFEGIRDCVYGLKVNDYTHRHAVKENYLLKKREHIHQREVRFAWRFADELDDDKRLVTCEGIQAFCRIRPT